MDTCDACHEADRRAGVPRQFLRLLLDTHALLWWLSDDARLGQPARELIADPANDVLVSVVSLWEILVKMRAGKLAADLREIVTEIESQAFDLLPIATTHLVRLGTLPMLHKDPFDHLLIAQAIVERALLVSEDGHILDDDLQVLPGSETGQHARR